MDRLTDDIHATQSSEGVCENAMADALIMRARSGDVEAFTELYSATAKWLLSRIRRLVGNSAAEDVLADVYIQVWNNLESFDAHRGAPKVWLAMIARSRALDHLRREKRIAALHDSSHQWADFGAPAIETPEQILSRAEWCRVIQVAMAGTLSSDEKLVLGLAYFRESSHQEVADSTGIPLGTVKTLINRAHKKLRTHLCVPVPSRSISVGDSHPHP